MNRPAFVTGKVYGLNGSWLLDKGGFLDGDLFEDLYSGFCDHFGVKRHPGREGYKSNDLLYDVVEKYLLPAIELPVKLEKVVTVHNGVRAVEIDGEAITDENIMSWRQLMATVSSAVTEGEVYDILADNLLPERKREPAA